MHTDNDPGKNLDQGQDNDEEGREKGLQWLLDMDMSEPEETLFTLKDDEYHDEGLSAFEAEVAGRPLIRGNNGGDDLANYVDEEIVISSEGGSDIFKEGAAADESESSESVPEVMAIDYSLGRKQKTEQESGAVDEGTDILGLQHDDDIGETYLTIKRVKGVAAKAEENAEQASSAGEDAGTVGSATDDHDQVICAEQADELPQVQLTDAPVPSQIMAPGPDLVANDGPEEIATDDVVEAASTDDPLGGALSLAEAAKLLEPTDSDSADGTTYLSEELVVGDEGIDLTTELSEFDQEVEAGSEESFDLIEEFEAFGESEDYGIDFPAEFETLEGVNDAEAVAIAALIPAVIDALSERVAVRASSLDMSASAVAIDVRMALDTAAVEGCVQDGFAPIATIFDDVQSAVTELTDTQCDALHVCLLGAANQQNWNHFFSDDFQVPQLDDESRAEVVDTLEDADLFLGSVATSDESVASLDDPLATLDDSLATLNDSLATPDDSLAAPYVEAHFAEETEDFLAADEDAADDIFGADFADDISDDFASGFDVQGDGGEDIDALFDELSTEEEMVLEAESAAVVEAEVETIELGEMPEQDGGDAAEVEVPFEVQSEVGAEAEAEIEADAEIEALAETETETETATEAEAADVADESEVEGQEEQVEQSLAALTAMIGATDASNPGWFAPEAIKFNYTTQSNAEIFADFLDAFIEEGSAEIEKLESLIGEWEKDVTVEAHYADVCRTLHTVKGIAKGVGLQRMGTLVHNFETLLEGLPRPVADEDQLYFRVVNIWLDAVVRGIEHITGEREDIASEIPQIGGSAAVALPVEDKSADTDEVAAKQKSEPKKKASRKKAAKKKASGKSEERGEASVEEAPASVEPQVSMLSALEKKRDKQLADEGAKVLAAQQSVRMTSEKLDLLLNLASQAQQLGVRASQNTTRSKRSSSELQGRLTSVRTHINKIADRALFNVNARSGGSSADMDALEMDQYSELQEAASILREGVEDLSDLVDVVSRQNAQVEAMLKQQSSVISSISSSIQGARVVPVSRLMPGLRRIVRTVSTDLGKTVSFNVVNETGALDRDHYARLQTVLEHMVRNALDHGIESADDRLAAGKPMGGRITIDVRKSGGDYIIRLSDDGRGIDADAIRQSAYEKGIDVDVDELSDEEAIRLIFHKGFTTASELSEISGRGVGMDIVLTELQQIGGDISIQSAVGLGTSFEVRIPSNVSVNGALLVAAADQSYAIPLNGLVAVEQVPVEEFFAAVEQGNSLQLFDLECEPAYLGTLCHSVPIPDRAFWDAFVPVIIAGAGDTHMAIAIDNVEEALELVVRSLGSQFSTVPGVAGAATTADGEALVALDLNLLVDSIGADGVAAVGKVEKEERQSLLALVVDDSRTQRMVATSQLETVGVETVTAENGLVAIDLLNATHRLPDVVLLDVEMPVKDGIETLREIRKSRRYGHLPVIMVTSRTGAKHRALAKDAGCNAYLGKPFNFPALIEQIGELTGQEIALS